jgi:hypothetical protein
MEIIKKGKLPEERLWQGECKNCNTIARAKEKELDLTHYQQDGLFGRANCPLCKQSIYFYPLLKEPDYDIT